MKIKTYTLSNPTKRYVRLGLYLFVFTTVVYHLIGRDNFPLSSNYAFPLMSILVSFGFSLIPVVLIERFYQRFFIGQLVLDKNELLRFFRQIVLISISVFLISYALFSPSWDPYYLVASFVLTFTNTVLWILIFYGSDFYKTWNNKSKRRKSLIVKSGAGLNQIDFADLSYFVSINKVVIACLRSGKKISTNFNLAELEKLLPEQFFRINRQYIVSREVVEQVARDSNQKLAIQIKDQNLEDLVVPRSRSVSFKRWLQRG